MGYTPDRILGSITKALRSVYYYLLALLIIVLIFLEDSYVSHETSIRPICLEIDHVKLLNFILYIAMLYSLQNVEWISQSTNISSYTWTSFNLKPVGKQLKSFFCK